MTRKPARTAEKEGPDDNGGRIISITSAFVCFLHSLGLPRRVQTHGGINHRILEITGQIRTDPDNAELYLTRGELYRYAHNWQAAMQDFDRAEQLDNQLSSVALARGRMMLEAGWLEKSKSILDEFIVRFPGHADALWTRARVLRNLGKYLEAAADQTLALQLSSEVLPEHYIDRAQMLLEAGEAYLQEALAGLEEGIARLGPVALLELQVADIEVQAELFDSALQRLRRLALQSPRKEKLLFRQGEILTHAGRLAEARERFAEALAHIEKLPARRRNARSNVVLESKIRVALGELIEELNPENSKASL